jgi:hypothetical protein
MMVVKLAMWQLHRKMAGAVIFFLIDIATAINTFTK